MKLSMLACPLSNTLKQPVRLSKRIDNDALL
jgi:hypothetical protein